MEPKGSRPSSWKPATKLFPEPGASSPHHAILFRIHFNIFVRYTERSIAFKFSNENPAWNFSPIPAAYSAYPISLDACGYCSWNRKEPLVLSSACKACRRIMHLCIKNTWILNFIKNFVILFLKRLMWWLNFLHKCCFTFCFWDKAVAVDSIQMSKNYILKAE